MYNILSLVLGMNINNRNQKYSITLASSCAAVIFCTYKVYIINFEFLVIHLRINIT